MAPDPSVSRSETSGPLPGSVLYLDDPYCWFQMADVREYLDRPAYAVRIDWERARSERSAEGDSTPAPGSVGADPDRTGSGG